MSGPADPFPLGHLDVTTGSGVSEARAGRFNALAVHAEFVAAGYTSWEADTLVQEVLERMAAT